MAENGKRPRRILHTADLHLISLGDKACQSLEAVVDHAIKAEVDLVIIAGDFFDHNRVSADLVNFAVEQLRRLSVQTLILPGNHDCLVKDSVYSREELVGLWNSLANVRILRAEQGENVALPDLNMSVWGKPICSYDEDTQPMVGVPVPHNGGWHIAIAHGYYSGTDSRHYRRYSISRDEIATSQQDYVALGHWPAFRCVCAEPVKAYYCDSPSISGTVNIVDLVEEGVEVSRFALGGNPATQ